MRRFSAIMCSELTKLLQDHPSVLSSRICLTPVCQQCRICHRSRQRRKPLHHQQPSSDRLRTILGSLLFSDCRGHARSELVQLNLPLFSPFDYSAVRTHACGVCTTCLDLRCDLLEWCRYGGCSKFRSKDYCECVRLVDTNLRNVPLGCFQGLFDRFPAFHAFCW